MLIKRVPHDVGHKYETNSCSDHECGTTGAFEGSGTSPTYAPWFQHVSALFQLILGLIYRHQINNKGIINIYKGFGFF